MEHLEVKPFKDRQTSKKLQVEEMFDSISGRYDFLNRFLSLGIDKNWRKKAIRLLKELNAPHILDVATGTADFALEASKQLRPSHITGIDLSEGMLKIGREKIYHLQLQNLITLVQADSENIPFEDNTFDAVTVSFGVRNFQDLNKGLSEMYRVLKPGGIMVILEFSKPKSFPVKQLYRVYFNYILPFWGKLIAKHNTAYSYLPESVSAFPEGSDFMKIFSQAGFIKTNCKQLSLGICSIYSGSKK